MIGLFSRFAYGYTVQYACTVYSAIEYLFVYREVKTRWLWKWTPCLPVIAEWQVCVHIPVLFSIWYLTKQCMWHYTHCVTIYTDNSQQMCTYTYSMCHYADWGYCSVCTAVHIVLVTDLVVLLTERDQKYNLPAILDLKVSFCTHYILVGLTVPVDLVYYSLMDIL